MIRPTRAARGAVIALALALVWAAPAAAAQPTRTVFYPHSHVDPAGSGCAFDVLLDPVGWDAATVFSDGTYVQKAQADVTVTNTVTGATFVHKARFRFIDRYDPATNLDSGITDGPVLSQFFPGDVGPFGVVEYPGLLLRFEGTTRSVFDNNTGFITEFSYTGPVTDICALIS